jgi:3-oxoacyl-[acyl-carrier protein] reductase
MQFMNLELKGKRVLVTGSSRGIGLGIADAFLAEGASVCLTGRNEEHLHSAAKLLSQNIDRNPSKTQDNSILSYVCDFSIETSICQLQSEIENKWQGLDILICNVGSGSSTSDIVPKHSEIQRVLSTNFYACTNAIEVFWSTLKKNHGSVVVISSIAGIESIGAPPAYSAAKAGLNAYVKALAKKYSETRVRVNTVAPGNVLFDGGSWAKKLSANRESVMRDISNQVPMQRFATPQEIANVAVFLASSAASFVNGSVYVVDGGQTSKFV